MLQDPQWMPEATDSTEPYIYFLLYLYSCDSLIYKLGSKIYSGNNKTIIKIYYKLYEC